MHKLKEERDEIDWQKSRRAGASRFREEDKHDARCHEFDGEDTTLDCGEDRKGLLDCKEDEENPGANEQADDAAAVPRICRASEVDSHDTRDVGADDEDCSDIIDLSQSLHDWHTRSRVVARQEKEPDWGEESSNAEVQVESPSPSCAAVGESTTNDRTKDGTKPPSQPRESNVCRSLMLRSVDGKKGHYPKI